MLIRLTKSNHSAQLIFLCLLTLLLWIRNFIMPVSVEIVEPQTFLYSALFDWTKTHVVLAKILAFVCVFLQALTLQEVVRTHSLSKNPIFVALVYIVLMSAQSDWQTMHPFLISNFFIIGAFFYLFKVYDRKESYEPVLYASMLFALASLFSASPLLLGVVALLIFVYYPINKWREWLIVFLGFGFPFIVVFLWASLSERMDVFSEFALSSVRFENIEKIIDVPLQVQIFRLFILIVSLLGMVFMRFHAKDNEISQRKKIGAMILGVCWIAIISLTSPLSNVSIASLLPFFAFFIAEWLYRNEHKWFPEVVFYLFLLVSFYALYT